MTKPLSFTVASLARAMKAVRLAGKHVIGIRPDGTLLVSSKPFDLGSLVPVPTDAQNAPIAKKRLGEKIHGGDSAS